MVELLNALDEFRYFFITVIITNIIVTAIFILVNKNKDRNKKSIFNIVFELKNDVLVVFVFMYLHLLFVISCVIEFDQLSMAQFFYFIISTIIIVGLTSRRIFSIYILANYFIQGCGLFLMNIVINYTLNIRSDMTYILIYIIGSILIIAYSLYVFLYEIQMVSKWRKEGLWIEFIKGRNSKTNFLQKIVRQK